MKLNWAERWAVNNPLRVLQQALEVRWLKKVMPLPPGCRILEIGSGRGVGSRLVRRKFGPSVVHVTDLDFQLVKMGRRYPGPGQDPRVCFGVADVIMLPYKTSSFHAVFGFGVLHHVLNWEEGLREISRVLVPGGLYFFEELYPGLYANVLTRRLLLHPQHGRFSSVEWKEALGVEGFQIIEVREIPRLGILGVARRGSQT